jgi:hypothetical protein
MDLYPSLTPCVAGVAGVAGVAVVVAVVAVVAVVYIWLVVVFGIVPIKQLLFCCSARKHGK